MGEIKRKKKHVGGKKEKKNLCVCNPETLALHTFPAFQYSIPTH